jgi:hypothetical protein
MGELAALSAERVPLGWAITQVNLGGALHALGERESGTANLEAAVAAYRAALEEQTRARVPDKRSEVQRSYERTSRNKLESGPFVGTVPSQPCNRRLARLQSLARNPLWYFRRQHGLRRR